MIQALLPLLECLDKVVPDKNANAKAKREIEKSLTDNANKILLAQTEINKVEAAHKDIDLLLDGDLHRMVMCIGSLLVIYWSSFGYMDRPFRWNSTNYTNNRFRNIT